MRCFDMSPAATRRLDMSPTAAAALRALERLRLLRVLPLERLHLLRMLTL
jgi:hypothetical protein